MSSLRSKLLLAQFPLVIAIVINGFVGRDAMLDLGRGLREVLSANYRSVLAAQRMKEFIERMDSASMFIAAGERQRGVAQLRAFEQRFEEELAVQEANITEPGEREATESLRALWNQYHRLSADFRDTPAEQVKGTYFAKLLPQFEAVKDAADKILAINQDAMLLKSDRAELSAFNYGTFLMLVAAAGCAGALILSIFLTTRLLRPLSVLGQAVRRFGEGDLIVRARLGGSDEIAQLARDFNDMAERLQQYRDSSLGELLEAQQAAQAAIDSLPDAVLIANLEGRVLHYNQAAQELLRLEPQPMTIDSLAMTPELREAVALARGHVLAGKGAFAPSTVEQAVHFGGQELLPRATPIYTASGSVAGTTIVLQDVTRLLRIEELRNDLVATVAHELRTPLTGLRMAIHMCIEGAVGPLNEKQADLLHAAREDAERLQTFVDELLDLSHIQAGRMVLVPHLVAAELLVRQAVEAQETSALQRHIRLRSVVVPGIEPLMADTDRIQLVFGNLLNNAIRYSPEHGEVVVRAFQHDGTVRFEVKDEGPGVPLEYRQSIFEKYAQVPGLPAGSAGLGLFIAKEIVEAHGGTIGVESEDNGSTFWFVLPVATAANAVE